jgi:hypothetical protein
MKYSSLILIILLGLFLASLVGSLFVLRNEYKKIDKSDPYWNYTKLAQGSFRYLKIDGGNITKIAFKPSLNGAIGVLNSWIGDMNGRVRAHIANDTLFVHFKTPFNSPGEGDWMRNRTLVSISCPELASVDGMNTNLEIYRFSKKDLAIHLAGRSHIEVECDNPDFDSISVHQQDSSEVVFEMSEDIRSSGVMQAKTISADIQGHSLLDIGHFRIGSLHAAIGDTAGIILSGASLRQFSSSIH